MNFIFDDESITYTFFDGCWYIRQWEKVNIFNVGGFNHEKF